MDPRDALLRTSDFVRTGRDDRALRRAAAKGDLVSIVAGVYLPTRHWNETDDRSRLLLRAAAVDDRRGASAVFSHATAAALHGWSLLERWPDIVDLTDPTVVRSRRGATARVHAFPLAAADVDVDVDAVVDADARPFSCTSPGRTAVDLAAELPFRDAVVCLDSALARRRSEPGSRQKSVLTLGEFDAALARRQPVRAPRRIGNARAFADGRSGSVGESVSRVVIAEQRWPVPVLQHAFFDAHGKIGEVDFWWPAFGVIGEFDGAVKYSRGEFLRGRTPAQAAVDEKRREDRLRAHPDVRGFARWMWDDLTRPRRLAEILAAAGLQQAR